MPYKDIEQGRKYKREWYRRQRIASHGSVAVREYGKTDQERFASYTCYTGDCVVWTGGADKRGYGRFVVDGGNMLSHRYAYQQKYGSIPDGLELDHICRNPPCVNAGHLEAVTHQVNVQRGMAGKHLPQLSRDRASRITHCPKGHEYNESNASQRSNGARQCLVCGRERNSRRCRRASQV